MGEQLPARILIAVDHRLLADACKSMLEPEFAVVGIVTNESDLMDAAAALKPEIIIMGSGLSPLNRLNAGAQIKSKFPATKLVFLIKDSRADVAAEAFRRGTSACVPMQASGKELVIAIRKVNTGEPYLSSLISKDTVKCFLIRNQTVEREITRRQTEILHLLVKGMSMKEVANHIDLTPRTVAFHKYKMMETLNIRTSAELIGYAMKRQLFA